MITLRVKQGDILFRQGDESDRVLWVSSGEIEVLRDIDGHVVLMGHVRAGEWLGETGVIENQPRSSTARAASDGEIQALTAREFLDRVSKDARLARGLLLRLSVRLRKLDDEVAHDLLSAAHDHHIIELDEEASHAIADKSGAISLTAQTDALRARMGAAPIEIGHFPYVVGRVPRPGEDEPAQRPDLLLEDTEPFHLSRQHFKIARSGSQFVVSDLGSKLGTIVNGNAIGHHFMRDTAALKHGENPVVAGGLRSPFEFVIAVG
jgi:CRP/FNR family transcriptional regulator, cyclic AMP receptor protein